jgi:hypothetical protein
MRTVSIILKSSLLAMCILIASQAYSQKKLEIAAGLGVPEYTNLKIRYGQNFQAGTCAHYWHYSAGGRFSAEQETSLPSRNP